MKRAAFLLAFLLIFSVVISSCNKQENSGSNWEVASDITFSSEVESSPEQPEDISDESNEDEAEKVESVITNISVSEKAEKTIISANASYVKSSEAASQYADSYSNELTDGITGIAKTYSDESLSGYTDNVLDVTIDLGGAFQKVYSFKVGYYSTNGAGIGAPWKFSVSGSLDGEQWIKLGDMTPAEFVEGAVIYANLDLNTYINVRYIKFTLNNAYPWMFFDEFMVFSDTENTNIEADEEFIESVKKSYQKLGVNSIPNNGNKIDFDLDKILISKGKKYTIDGNIDNKFTDNSILKLTDGLTSNYYEGGTWIGFRNNDSVTVKVDLGNNVNDIAVIEASFFVNKSIRLYMPTAVKFTAIDNKNKRTELGILYGNTVFDNGDYTFSLPFRSTVSARYIELTFYSVDTSLLLIDEIGVYAYRESKELKLYPDLVLEDNATEWGNDSNDVYENLIFGKTQQILTVGDPNEKNCDSQHNTPVTSKLMTDGKFAADTNIHNGSFFKFSGGSGRKIIYDLEHISSVDKFTASFTCIEDWAVYKPNYIFVLASNDGKDWYNLGEIKLQGDGEDAIYKGELVLNRRIKARYVAFEITIGTWAGCDELEVYGYKNTQNAISPKEFGLESRKLYEDSRTAPSNDILNGAKHLCLLYFSSEAESYTVNDLMPYLAYLDENGNPKDLMFDSFLFLSNNSFPNGVPQTGSYKSDWDWTINHLFTDDKNVMALEKAAGDVKSKLGFPDNYKYKVTFAVYYPSPTITDFGDVDGDGITEDLSIYDNRIKVMKWYINELKKHFDECNFENIELVGYYWWQEDLVEDEDIVQLINDTSKYIHSIDQGFFWIPWFGAKAYSLWETLGFDVACLQPNYVFDANADIIKVINCAKITKLLGMGIEMEISEESLRNMLFFEKYMKYMAGGIEYGYMTDSINMYYQSYFVYRDAAYSDDIMARTIYDTTYHYIKGDLQYSPDKLSNLNFTSQRNEIFNGNVDFKQEKLREVKLSVAPEHGTVTLNNDGTFIYYPEKDFVGEVTFSFVYSEYLGWSEDCQITINVK